MKRPETAERSKRRLAFAGALCLLLIPSAASAELGLSLTFSSYSNCLTKLQKLQAAAGSIQSAGGEIRDDAGRKAYCRRLFPLVGDAREPEPTTPQDKLARDATPEKSATGDAATGTITASSTPVANGRPSSVSLGAGQHEGGTVYVESVDSNDQETRKISSLDFSPARTGAPASGTGSLPAAASSASGAPGARTESQAAYQSYMASLGRDPASDGQGTKPSAGSASFPAGFAASQAEVVSPGASGPKKAGGAVGPAPGANPPRAGKPGTPTRDPQIEFAELQKMLLDKKMENPALTQMRAEEQAATVSLFDRVRKTYRARSPLFRQNKR